MARGTVAPVGSVKIHPASEESHGMDYLWINAPHGIIASLRHSAGPSSMPFLPNHEWTAAPMSASSMQATSRISQPGVEYGLLFQTTKELFIHWLKDPKNITPKRLVPHLNVRLHIGTRWPVATFQMRIVGSSIEVSNKRPSKLNVATRLAPARAGCITALVETWRTGEAESCDAGICCALDELAQTNKTAATQSKWMGSQSGALKTVTRDRPGRLCAEPGDIRKLMQRVTQNRNLQLRLTNWDLKFLCALRHIVLAMPSLKG